MNQRCRTFAPSFSFPAPVVLALIVAVLLAGCGAAGSPAPERSSDPGSEPAGAGAQPAGTGDGRPAEASRRMAVTFDDLPAAPPWVHDTEVQTRLTDKLLATLAEHEVPAVGLVNEERLEVDGRVDPGRVALLERWLDDGHELGNHTYSHPDLHRVPLAEFQEDVVRGERITRRLLAERGRELRWFRHPFLHTGRDLETKHGLEAFLEERGYRIAPVTVDNSEWIYGGAYARAYERGDREAMERLAADYVDYMVRMVEFYEGQSRALFGREIPQVLLVHAYMLNANHAGELLDRLEERGYEWIRLDEALEDPAYDEPDTYTGPAGITWLHRWALTRDVDRSMFAGEPTAPDWVREAAGLDAR